MSTRKSAVTATTTTTTTTTTAVAKLPMTIDTSATESESATTTNTATTANVISSLAENALSASITVAATEQPTNTTQLLPNINRTTTTTTITAATTPTPPTPTLTTTAPTPSTSSTSSTPTVVSTETESASRDELVEDIVTEMGAHTSSVAEEVTEPESTPGTGCTPTKKDLLTPKAEATKAGELKRITRNSPLPRSSPSASDKKATDSEPANSESEESAVSGGATTAFGGAVFAAKRSYIRGRKPLKEVTKEAGDNSAAALSKEKSSESLDKDIKDNKDKDDSLATAAAAAAGNESKDSKELKESKDHPKDVVKETKAGGSKETPSTAAAAASSTASFTNSNSTSLVSNTFSNRCTRKSAAQDLIATTRVTRNRQASGSRSDTPPVPVVAAAGRGRRPARKMAAPTPEPATKRKRSDEESGAAHAEPSVKYIKVEVKGGGEEEEDTVSNDSVKIKQEIIESDDTTANENATTSSALTTATATATATTTTTHSGRGRGRWGSRKQAAAAANLQNSPTTRSTRQSKMNSPSPSPSVSSTGSDVKRRRMMPAAAGATVTRSHSAASLLKASHTHLDEDSKDSMASSMDEVLADLKLEKLTPEMEDEDFHVGAKQDHSEKVPPPSATPSPPVGRGETLKKSKDNLESEKAAGKAETKSANCSAESLGIKIMEPDTNAATKTVDSNVANEKTAYPASEASTDKAVSLSPELVSEGVCEISVKQFYKKPEFLENNLGIEEDPKLGEIVQQVSTEAKTGASSAERTEEEEELEGEDNQDDVVSISSLKESFEERSLLPGGGDGNGSGSGDGDGNGKKLGATNDDDNSNLNTEHFSTFIVDEDDDDEDEEHPLVVDETHCEDHDMDSMAESEIILIENNASADEMTEEATVIEAMKLVVSEEREEEEEELAEKGVGNTQVSADASCNKEGLKSEEKVIKLLKESAARKEADEGEGKEKSVTTIALKRFSVESDSKPCLLNTNSGATKGNQEKGSTLVKNEKGRKEEKVAAEGKEVEAKECTKLKEKREKEALVVASGKQKDEVTMPEGEGGHKLEAVTEVLATEETVNPKSVAEAEAELTIKLEAEDEPKAADKTVSVKFSKLTSPLKLIPSINVREEDTTHSTKSGQSTDTANSWATLDLEYDEETLRQKEQHLQNLGLLTHKAAEQRRQEFIQSSAAAVEASQRHTGTGSGAATSTGPGASSSGTSTKRNGKATTAHEYTGTLKTVIKLNRSGGGAGGGTGGSGSSNGVSRKNTSVAKEAAVVSRRQSLKMTFQKGRGRGQAADRAADNLTHMEDSYYTIQNENEGALKTTALTEPSHYSTHCRKSHNRSNHTSSNFTTSIASTSSTTSTANSTTLDSSHSEGQEIANTAAIAAAAAAAAAAANNKTTEKEEILIPEKASSFKFHPGRLCQDQCFYCSGKFGLYDTPCHVGQIKSTERQQKILANEEKLTVDNCLCDACFRHVDRRANVPSYKKRLSASGHPESAASSSCSSSVVCGGGGGHTADDLSDGQQSTISAALEEVRLRKCLVPECVHPALHSLRRKCIRRSVKKFLLNFDMPTTGTYVSLCQAHYDAVIQCSGCVLCKRRLGKNHMYHITSDTDRLEKALSEMGIPVQLGIGTAVCKLCRYFANLLMKPPDSSKSQKAEFVKNYRKRLLQFHNIHEGSNDVSEADDEENKFVRKTSAANQSAAGLVTPQKNAAKQLAKGAEREFSGLPTPIELASPTGSTGSSVELIDDETPALATAAANVAVTPAVAAVAPPTSSSTPLTNNKGGGGNPEMLLDNNVMVDYDVPMISSDSNASSPLPPANNSRHNNSVGNETTNNDNNNQMSKLKAILQSSTTASASYDERADISTVLRSNPNISMRELFPGEEDLGLQFKAPFGSSNSQRTPEGWTRVQTFLQYDEPTRRLWEELQKPYGNQSSFLRHLILLEKYFRNGDLVLTPNASSNASVYTQTVRQRLTSYDKGHCGGLESVAQTTTKTTKTTMATPKVNAKAAAQPQLNVADEVIAVDESNGEEEEEEEEARSEILSKQLRTRSISVDKLAKQLNTNAVTITARPKDTKDATASASPQKSLLLGSSSSSSSSNAAKEKEAAITTTISTLTSNAPNLAAAAAAAAAAVASTSAGSAGSSNSRSILKSNLLGLNNKSVEIVPISSSSSKAPPASSSESKHQKILEVANKLLGNQLEAAATCSTSANSAAANAVSSNKSGSIVSLLTSPPELVSLQRRTSSSGSSLSAVLSSTAPAPAAAAAPIATSATATSSSSTTASLINAKRPHLLPKAGTTNSRSAPPNVVILPDTLTPQERLQSKSWRPTLMPVEENQHLVNKSGPLYQTADGRRLPALVQVQSGGKPFLISIFDYNRMCILRREKLLRDQMLKATKNRREQQQQHQQQRNAANAAAVAAAAAQANLQNAYNSAVNKQQQTAQQQLIHLQLMQMQKHQQKQQQQAALKSIGRYQAIAPKPSSATATNSGAGSTSTTTTAANIAVGGGNSNSNMNNNNNNNNSINLQQPTNFNTPMMPLLANAINNAAVGNANNAAAAAAAANASWLWNNFPDANQLLMNGAAAAAAAAAASSGKQLPHLLPKPSNHNFNNATTKQHNQHNQQQQNQLLLDNTLMSKIPKSLTVIPQHKLMAGANAGVAMSGGIHKD